MSSKHKVSFPAQTSPLVLLGLLTLACRAEEITQSDEGLTVRPDPSDCADWASWMQNVEDGLAVLARADSAALAVEELLLDIRARAAHAGSEVTAEDERDRLHGEYEALLAAIEQLALATDFDGTHLTDGSSSTWDVTVSDDASTGTVSIPLADLRPTALGVGTSTVDLTSPLTALDALDAEADALDIVADWRASLATERQVLLAIGDLLEGLHASCAGATAPSDDAPTDGSFGLGPVEGEQAVIEALLENFAEARALLGLADDGATTTEEALLSIRELAVASSSETVADEERASLQCSYEELVGVLEYVSSATEYNDMQLLDGSTGLLQVLVDDCSGVECRYDITLFDLTSMTLGVDTASMDLSSAMDAQNAIDIIDTALDSVASHRATFGAQDGALAVLEEHTARQLEE